MTSPVTYVELNTPDLAASSRFFAAVFGWDPQPFAAPDYLVAPAGDGRGVDAGLLASRDGTPRVVPVINVASLDAAARKVVEHGGTVVVEPFTIPGVGRGCYFTDPSGLIVGLHQNDPGA
jgi:predicted enzyme related to lactoylglutathione lyase